jgi:hypothetical protein
MENPTTSLSVPQSTGLPTNSVLAQPSLTLQAAIRSPHDQGATLKRVNACLALYFVPDEDAETKLDVRAEFVRALSAYPQWAVERAFDDWIRTRNRRPSPGEIAILASGHLKPLADELARRQREEADSRARAISAQMEKPSPEAARRILESAGFTPQRFEAVKAAPMAGSFAEAEERAAAPKKPHWSEVSDPDGFDMQTLRAARAKNEIMRAGMSRAEKGETQ